MGDRYEESGDHGEPCEPTGHESKAGGPGMIGLQYQHNRRDYRNRRQRDNECERRKLAEQRLSGLAGSSGGRGVPDMQQAGQPAEID